MRVGFCGMARSRLRGRRAVAYRTRLSGVSSRRLPGQKERHARPVGPRLGVSWLGMSWRGSRTSRRGLRPLRRSRAPWQEHAHCDPGAGSALPVSRRPRRGGMPRAVRRAGQPLAISGGSAFRYCAKVPARHRRKVKSRCPRHRPARCGRSGGHRPPPPREARN